MAVAVESAKNTNPENTSTVTTKYDNLEWINMNEILLSDMQAQEGVKEKLVRKTKENPFVPIGAVATTMALSYGLWNMTRGNPKISQAMMRTRVVAQGLTITAILVGIGIGASKSK